MNTFERGFADAEKASEGTIRAAKAVALSAEALKRAAKEGNIQSLRKAVDRLDATLAILNQEAANARSSWPFSPDKEEGYLREQYAAELLQHAKSEGLQIHRWDDALAVFPSVVRILPQERSLSIDKKKIASLRPHRVLQLLKTVQNKQSSLKSDAFLETLYKVYCLLEGKEEFGKAVLLADVYKLLTLLPTAAREYDRQSFARDLLMLDRSSVRQTKTGFTFSFPASTGTKGSKDVIAAIAPDGEMVTFYGVRFERV